jgi:hypothetical protein
MGNRSKLQLAIQHTQMKSAKCTFFLSRSKLKKYIEQEKNRLEDVAEAITFVQLYTEKEIEYIKDTREMDISKKEQGKKRRKRNHSGMEQYEKFGDMGTGECM